MSPSLEERDAAGAARLARRDEPVARRAPASGPETRRHAHDVGGWGGRTALIHSRLTETVTITSAG